MKLTQTEKQELIKLKDNLVNSKTEIDDRIAILALATWINDKATYKFLKDDNTTDILL